MDYKEKYNAALKRAKKLYGEGTITECLGWVFPELEDEDERIKREILELVSISSNGNQFEEIKDWLEKQGEKKPVDKVEPKFNVGDWIVLPLSIIAHIDSLNSTDYQVTTTDGKICDFKISKQDNYRLWTINDAKDGDVFVDKSDGTIGIFQSIGHHPDGGSYNDHSYCFLYCRYDDVFFYADFEHGNTIDSDDLIPATKEQCDLLFEKMKEEGYDWDAKNNTLWQKR